MSSALESLAFDIADVIQQMALLSATGGKHSSLGSLLGTVIGGAIGFGGSSAPTIQTPGNTSTSALIGSGKVKGFASGGHHGGGLRIVGENGPELEATGPARIFDAEQTRRMLSDAATPRAVAGAPAGANIDVNIYNETGGQVETRQNGDGIDVFIRKTVSADIRDGGPIYKTLRQRFNLNPNLQGRS